MTLTELLEKHEGRKRKPYKCPAGFKTIGVGWNLEANPLPARIAEYLKENGEITEEMIDTLLEASIIVARNDCKSLFPEFNKFSKSRKMALIDFVFQLGRKRASRFVRAVAAINTGRWEDAAKEMGNSSWYKQTPTRAEEIIEMIEGG
jgi:lysozyme